MFLRRKKNQEYEKKNFFSSREISHFLFSRVFTITWRSFDSGMFSEQPYTKLWSIEKVYGIWAQERKLLDRRRALVACVFVYCIFISLVILKIFVNFPRRRRRRRFHYLVWPLKIFKLKFTISCCWSSRLYKANSHHRGTISELLVDRNTRSFIFLSVCS